jgi:hypothetical protein
MWVVPSRQRRCCRDFSSKALNAVAYLLEFGSFPSDECPRRSCQP